VKQHMGCSLFGMVIVGLLLINTAQASTPVIWEQSSQRDFQKGNPSRISIASQGYLTLSPSLVPLFETNEPLVWCLAADSKGNLYAGTGNDGKLYKIDPNGQGQIFFDVDELEIHSATIDASDHIYVATFPDGKIYKVTPDGQSSIFFDPNENITAGESVRYIWSLTMDTAGNLYAGTGEQGRIYKIDKNGRATILAETEETHVVTMIMDRNGNLIAGTEPNGRVYRITPSGTISVLYDSPYQEIHTLLVDSDGYIYAGALNEPPIRPQGGQPSPRPSPQPTSNIPSNELEVGVIEVTASPNGRSTTTTSRASVSGGGIVYRIRPDGVVEEWWRSREDAALSLARQEDGTILIGTGPNGKLYAVPERGRRTELAQLSEAQITAFMPTSSGEIMVAASNLGNIYRMGQRPVREGVFESEVYDTQGTSVWGRIHWDGTQPNGTGIQFFVRSGNTDAPDQTWSDWTGPYTDPDGEPISCPATRYIQWKTVLNSRNDLAPRVSRVSIAYLTRNVAPTVNSITVYEPGVYLRDASNGTNGENDLPPKIAGQIGNRSNNRQGSAGVPAYQKGLRAVAINATDSNQDMLSYAVYFRGEEETQWKLLKEDLHSPSYSWDSETFPDGMYTIKVIVSDAPSNPPVQTLQSEMISEPFLVDNMAPRITDINMARRALSFTVQDVDSPVFKVEYAIDGGDWLVVYPTDGVADSSEETFDVMLNDLNAEEHTIAIRARDTSNNLGTGKQVIVVE
jgi:hypothetical protein